MPSVGGEGKGDWSKAGWVGCYCVHVLFLIGRLSREREVFRGTS